MSDVNWELFNMKDLFSIEKGTRLTIENRVDGDIPFVTAGHDNQGVSSFIGNDDLKVFSNVITIDMFAEAFYRGYSFCCDDNIHVLTPFDDVDKYALLFIVAVINSGNVWDYGKQYRLKTFDIHKVLLPVDDDGNPDYQYMCDYMKSVENDLFDRYIDYLDYDSDCVICDLDSVCWGEFRLEDVFDEIQRGKRLVKNDFVVGDTPYISSSASDNGIDGFIGNSEDVRFFSDCLTLANSGSVGTVFYHPYRFVASDHVTHLKNECFDKYVYLFIGAMVSRLGEKYNFNREINDSRLRREVIMLPVTGDGCIDFDFMCDYMMFLERSLLERYLDFVR